MPVVVILPAALREPGSSASMSVEAGSLRAALESLGPRLSNRLIDESGQLRRHVNVFVNRKNTKALDGLETGLRDGDEVVIIPAVAGG